MLLIGKQLAWMNHEHFKISDKDGTVLDISELMKIVLRGGACERSTRSETKPSSRQKQPDEICTSGSSGHLISSEHVVLFFGPGDGSEIRNQELHQIEKEATRQLNKRFRRNISALVIDMVKKQTLFFCNQRKRKS